MSAGTGPRTTPSSRVSAAKVPTDAQPHEAPPGEICSWPSIDAWFADPGHYWYPEPEAERRGVRP